MKGMVLFGTTPVGAEKKHDIDLLVFSTGWMEGTDDEKFEQIFRKHMKVNPHVVAFNLSDPERKPDDFLEGMRRITVYKTLFSDSPPERWKQTNMFRIYPWNYIGDETLGQ
ncbi:MAG: hypothetical protein FJY77_06195, partial [Candidatus Altiarchaeales archaeon]|nr:hypothetical protein [Candidatus Altiarchaeales archaeon]